VFNSWRFLRWTRLSSEIWAGTGIGFGGIKGGPTGILGRLTGEIVWATLKLGIFKRVKISRIHLGTKQ